jgi:hypothetical protein
VCTALNKHCLTRLFGGVFLFLKDPAAFDGHDFPALSFDPTTGGLSTPDCTAVLNSAGASWGPSSNPAYITQSTGDTSRCKNLNSDEVWAFTNVTYV